MALDGKLLAQARKQLDDIRHHNEDKQSTRQREIYGKLPAVRQIDLQLQLQMRELASIALSGKKTVKEDVTRLEGENLRLQARRRELLMAAGYPADYTDDRFNCPDCNDTGYVSGKMCRCLKRLYNAQVTKKLSNLLKGDESFAKFQRRSRHERRRTPGVHGDRVEHLQGLRRAL